MVFAMPSRRDSAYTSSLSSRASRRRISRLCLVAGLRAFYYGRRKRCNVCFVSLTVYVFYKLTDSIGEARQYGSAQRARLAPPVSTAHSFPQSSTPDGVAAAGIVGGYARNRRSAPIHRRC